MSQHVHSTICERILLNHISFWPSIQMAEHAPRTIFAASTVRSCRKQRLASQEGCRVARSYQNTSTWRTFSTAMALANFVGLELWFDHLIIGCQRGLEIYSEISDITPLILPKALTPLIHPYQGTYPGLRWPGQPCSYIFSFSPLSNLDADLLSA